MPAPDPFPIPSPPQISVASLRVITPGNPVSNPVEDAEISSSQIDAIVGNNHFSTVAADLFSDFGIMKNDLTNKLKGEILALKDVESVEEFGIEFAPISAKISQYSDIIDLLITGINSRVVAKASSGFPIICGTVKFTAEISSVGKSNYDFFTGNVADIVFSHDINVIKASCSGIFGAAGNLIAKAFMGGVNGQVEEKIAKALRDFGGIENLPTLFSLDALTRDLSQALPSGIVKDKVLGAVNHFTFLTTQSSGLELEISLHPDFYGQGQNLVTLTASQEQPVVTSHRTVTGTRVEITDRANGIEYRIYKKAPFDTEWSYFLTTRNPVLNAPILTEGTTLMVVANNELIPGLKSFPGKASVQPFNRF